MAAVSENAGPVRLTVGVLGGMGPEATVDFMSRVIAMTPANVDQDHVPMVVHNNPQVPDRQQAMRDGHGGPVRRALLETARRLQAGGADFWVMPCNTAHAFVGDAVAGVSIPFVSIIDVTIESIRTRAPGARRIGLLATDACLAAGVYQRAMGDTDMTAVLPDEAAQDECMGLIFRVKGGDTGPDVRERMAALAEALVRQGAELVIAGCTEIPLVLDAADLSVPLVSSTEELARRSVEIATGARPLPPLRGGGTIP